MCFETSGKPARRLYKQGDLEMLIALEVGSGAESSVSRATKRGAWNDGWGFERGGKTCMKLLGFDDK